ncbi:unnamed protein product [Bursaphelenchus xylophilus]|uniref:(pine wood nematode) hypothetical protein n=1 Tax=Bursaphelenchus xylophilus TaxID=6326 RepID=A0A1I7S914_BURXY|nr:unnamed protein product [Bursaphelenchus xylophilus]CAG9086134.1 unnamed protein product [Bursaphelenchus xylophilus]
MSGNRVLSVLEKAKMVCWFEETNSLAMVARRYRSEFGVEPPTLGQIKRIHRQFLETGSVVSQPITSASSAITSNLLNNQTLNSAEAIKMSQQAMNLPSRESFV